MLKPDAFAFKSVFELVFDCVQADQMVEEVWHTSPERIKWHIKSYSEIKPQSEIKFAIDSYNYLVFLFLLETGLHNINFT